MEWYVKNLSETDPAKQFLKIMNRQKLNTRKSYSLTGYEDTDFQELTEIDVAEGTILHLEGIGINGDINLYAKIGATEIWGTNSATSGYITQRVSPLNGELLIDRWFPKDKKVYLKVVNNLASATTPYIVLKGWAYEVLGVDASVLDDRGDPVLPKLRRGEVPAHKIKIEPMSFV